MIRFLLAVCVAGALAYPQPAIAPPRVGLIQDSNHSLRPVLGLAGNFALDASLGEGITTSAFSGSYALVKTDTSIMVLDRDGVQVYSMDADAGPALFAFSNEGAPAFVYLVQSQTLQQWQSDHFEPAPFAADQVNGVVLAIASPGPGRLTLIAKRDDGMWTVDLSGASQFLIPPVDGPVLLRNDGSLLYATVEGFVLHHADGTDQAVGGPGLQPVSLGFEQMAQDWIHVTEQNSLRHFAIRLTPGHEQTYQLPEAQQ
jgi:hypothetical protein